MSNNNTLILPEAKTDGAKMIASRAAILASISPQWLAVDRYLPMAMAEANRPELADCYGPSLVKCAFNCAVIGLMPGDAMGHAWFVPFKNKKAQGRKETQLIIGYKGYLDLAYRSGFLVSSHPEVIVDSEEFELWNDENGQHVRHNLTPRYKGDSPQPDKSNIIGAYCVYQTKGGGKGLAGVTRTEINKIDTGRNVWLADFPAMCRKTAVLRARKDWRVTLDFERAAMLDECERAGEPQPALAGDIEGDGEPVLSLGDLPTVEEETAV